MTDSSTAVSGAALLRVLVVDDERLGRKRLLDLLDREAGTVVVGAAENGREAVELIRSERPDLVLLDVQMPDISGLDVVREVGAAAMPITVFVTAYDQHALQAFELAALDYLLKPFDDERFAASLARAREAVRLRGLGELGPDLSPLLAGGVEAPGYPERITVEVRGQRRFVPVAEIDYVTADGPYAVLHTGGRRYVVREQMSALEAQLDPALFFRIHRSAIVRLARVEMMVVGSGGDYTVRLHGGTELRVARGRRDQLVRRMER